MKTCFEWQAEDQSEFGETDSVEEGRASGKRPGCLAATLTLSAVFAILFAWQLNRSHSEAIASVTEEVILAFELQQRAAESGDEELFSALLSNSDLAWKRDQERLLKAGLINDRGLFDLAGVPHTLTDSTIDLSPDLQKAELFYVQEYKTSAGSANTLDLALRHTIFYRLEDGRWKQTAVDHSYWGSRDEKEGVFAVMTFPERDAGLAQVLFAKLEHQLEQLCEEVGAEHHYGSAFCAGTDPLRINLSTDDMALLKYSETPVANTSAFDYELPAPSIVGVPRDDDDTEVYIDLYARSLMQHVERLLLSTAPYPIQDIYGLCFKHPLNGRHLYRYDWHSRSWHPLLAAQTFEHLSPLPDYSAIMLVGDRIVTMIDVSPNSIEHTAVRQGNLPEVSSQSLVGWIDLGQASFHLVQHGATGGAPPGYSALDLRECDAHGCTLEALPGFPIPAVNGDATLYQIGSEIVLISDKLDDEINLGAGFSPFWLDGETFGFVRFTGDIASGINTEVVRGSTKGDGLKRIFDGSDLARVAGIQFGSVLFVNEVVPNPADPGLLQVSSTGIRDYAGRYYLFSVDVSNRTVGPEITLEVARNGSQGGVPGLFTPTGPPLFLISSNGRWLAMTELKSGVSETWTVLVHDLEKGTTSEVSKSVPAMPGNYPLLDWSSDGQWLLVADRHFLHLIAPAYEIQEMIAHDFDACSHIIWAY